ncbi:MAG: hypothetical protein QOH76_2963 [Thermoleophilaceae bacterium]|nr:hypothetical protein [Thermoleophilaceae bacterium]
MGVLRRLTAVLVAFLALGGTASADCFGPPPGFEPAPKPAKAGLRFGMYPGGVAGQLGPAPAAPKPDDPAKQLAALADLRPADGPFVVHLYRSYLSDENDAREDKEAQRLVERYARAGYLVEFVVRYRRDDDVAGYVRFLRGLVDRFASNPRVVGLQVANEVNFTFSPDSSDGAYAGARDALIQGVIAAKDEARSRGYRQLEVGFNWVYRLDPQTEQTFWGHLRDHGGHAFVKSLDWIGLDAYPGTFFPPAATPPQMRTAMIDAMDELRCYSGDAGIPKSVPIHVAENGYPTGPHRTYETQKEALETMVGTVAAYRANYNVSDYRWFDLRDADTSSPNFQQQYGLMTDAYKPKPAYASWKRLVGQLSVKEAGTPAPPRPRPRPRPRLRMSVSCYWRGVRAVVAGRDVGRVLRVVFRARGTTVVVRRRPFRRTVRLRPEARARGITVRASAALRGGGTIRFSRRVACRRAEPS